MSSFHSFIRRFLSITNRALRESYARLPLQGTQQAVFILGCARSGTTVFGKALGQHAQVTYLNERRDLWAAAYPQTDIWSPRAERRNGSLYLGASNAESNRNHRLRRYFLYETKITGRPILVEKTPINNFRLELIANAFPRARFVHIHRNGLEVARSIERRSQHDRWFGHNNYKWHQLVEYASEDPSTSALPALTDTAYEKGLLEWRLSTEAVVRFFSESAQNFFEISYAELSDDPVSTISNVLEFLGLSMDCSVLHFAHSAIQRQSPAITRTELSDKERLIGGQLLQLSLSGKPLTGTLTR